MVKILVLHHLDPIMTEDGIRYRHPLATWILMTEGVSCLAQSCEASWLVDVIVSTQELVREVGDESTQKWCLKVAPDQSAVLTCSDLEKRTLFSMPIPFTDFPHPQVTLWVMDDLILFSYEFL